MKARQHLRSLPCVFVFPLVGSLLMEPTWERPPVAAREPHQFAFVPPFTDELHRWTGGQDLDVFLRVLAGRVYGGRGLPGGACYTGSLRSELLHCGLV